MHLSTTIAGVTFPTCFMNAAGACCVTQKELEALGASQTGAIVTKSMTPQPRTGNPEPRYYSFPSGSINSMGLPNLGVPAYAALIPALRRFGKPIVASIAGLTPQDFLDAAHAMQLAQPDLVEVNLSCPNIQGKPQIGYDIEASRQLLVELQTCLTIPMGVKLPPYFDPIHHKAMADLLTHVKVSFLSLINSVGNGLVVEPQSETVVLQPNGGLGGLGGAMIKPVALANVRAFWKLFQGRMPIIGVGGIVTGTDVFEHLLCGASAVQVGTTLVDEGLTAFNRLKKELAAVLTDHGYTSAEACRGCLKEL